MRPDSDSEALLRSAIEQQLGEAADEERLCLPPPIADHTLLRRIGRGAYGDVWLARNALGTLRAVKVVYRARFKEERPYEREFNGILKYEPLSRTHEGLVQVLHVGRNDEAGCFYYVMELADDSNAENGDYQPRTLRFELARQQRLSPIDAAQLVLRLAGALAHLHRHGLVHRDIKPSNVIFVGGQPKLADIGLVTDVGESRSFVGTEGFIPPEGPGTPQADLYGLGKVLYELSTGRDRLDFPQLPPRVAQLPEGEGLLELNEVMARACAPDPDDRYANATELQAELNLFLAGRSLRRARNLERHLARLKRLAFAACAVLVLAGVAVWFSNREARQAGERARAETALRQRAQAAEHERESQLYAALLEQARATVRSGEMGQRMRALDAARRAGAISNTAELRREVVAALALPDLGFKREWTIGPELTGARFDPKFERFALLRGRASVEIRSITDDGLLATLPRSTNLMSYLALWSPDGRFLAVKRDYSGSGHRGDVEVWEVTTARLILIVRDMRWNSCSFHPQKPELLTAGTTGLIVAWDLEAGKELARARFPVTPHILAYSPDGNHVAAAYRGEQGWGVSVHAAGDATLVAVANFASQVSAIDWHPSGRWVGVTDMTGTIHLVDARTGESRALGRHAAEATLVNFNTDGRYLLTAGWERQLICWDLQSMRRAFVMPLDSFKAHFSADGTQLAVVKDANVQLHTFERPEVREFPEDLGARLRHAAFSSDGRWLAASADKRLGVWDLSGTGVGAFADEGAQARPFFSPDNGELLGSGSGNCFRWRLIPGGEIEMVPQLEPAHFPASQAISALCAASNIVSLTGAQGTQLLTPGTAPRWMPTPNGISSISPDGRWLGIYAPYGAAVDIYELPHLKPITRLSHPASVGNLQFSPRGDEAAVSSRSRTEFWSTATWKRTRVITNFARILYTADARTGWLIKDYFGSAALHDLRSLEPLLPLPANTLPLALSSDGRHLAASVDARRLQLWDLIKVREHLRSLGLDWDQSN